jgi:hypothetical protein
MSFLGLVVLVAALVPLLTGGSYRRLADAPWRWGGLLALGLGLQVLLDTGLVPKSAWHSVGFGILVASYVVIVGFCAGNLLVRGMAVVLIGVALNGFVVMIDQGMPVKVPPDWQSSGDRVSATVKHHPRVAGDHLLALTDIIVLRKLDAVISFGDLIIAFGLVDATYWASRRARRTRTLDKHADLAPAVRDVLGLPGIAPAPAPAPVPVPATARRPDRTRPPRSRQPVRAGAARERSDRAEPTDRAERSDSVERTERAERSDPAERSNAAERAGRPVRAEAAERVDRPKRTKRTAPPKRSAAGGSSVAIKEALERLEGP